MLLTAVRGTGPVWKENVDQRARRTAARTRLATDRAAARCRRSACAGEHVHLTAEAVHAAAQALLPEISLATVYNTLNELVNMGEVLEISDGNGPKRYDPNTTMAHQHLLCIRCGTLRDVAPKGRGWPDAAPG
jgi:hypothetical protein